MKKQPTISESKARAWFTNLDIEVKKYLCQKHYAGHNIAKLTAEQMLHITKVEQVYL
jgi:(2Fe-2S) ferredoxin